MYMTRQPWAPRPGHPVSTARPVLALGGRAEAIASAAWRRGPCAVRFVGAAAGAAVAARRLRRHGVILARVAVWRKGSGLPGESSGATPPAAAAEEAAQAAALASQWGGRCAGRFSDGRASFERLAAPLEGFLAGWPELDALFCAAPGEVTLLDGDGAERLALEWAKRLADSRCSGLPRTRHLHGGRWHVDAVFDYGTEAGHCCRLQDFSMELPWILQHFSFFVEAPRFPIATGYYRGRIFKEHQHGEPQRAVILVRTRKGSGDVEPEDANCLIRRARATGVHVWVVRPKGAEDVEEVDDLARVCDNHATVSTCAAGAAEVRVLKVRNWRVGGADARANLEGKVRTQGDGEVPTVALGLVSLALSPLPPSPPLPPSTRRKGYTHGESQ